jgi:hypothetical protein
MVLKALGWIGAFVFGVRARLRTMTEMAHGLCNSALGSATRRSMKKLTTWFELAAAKVSACITQYGRSRSIRVADVVGIVAMAKWARPVGIEGSAISGKVA